MTSRFPIVAVSAVVIVFACACGKNNDAPADKPGAAATKPAGEAAKAEKPAKPAAEAAEPTGKQAAAEAAKPAAAGSKLKLVKPAEDIDWAAIKKEVAKHKGKVARCNNLLAPVPLAVSDFADKEPVAMIEGPVDDRRSAFFCRTKAGGLDSVPVQVYFPKGDKGQLLHVDRDTEVNVEVRGELGNQVVGVFRGVTASPRRQVFDVKAPDLLSALIWPDTFKGKTVLCRSKMAVTPQTVADFDRAAVEMVGGDVAAQKALVRCEDRRGDGVSVMVFFPSKRGAKVLELGTDTQFTVKLQGFDRNQLVGMFGELQSGAVEAGKGELKQVLVDPDPAVGKTLECEALVAPQPREIGAVDGKETAILKVGLDDRKTALMCAQRSGGSVGVSLYFKKGDKKHILSMAAKTRVAFDFWGVVHNRLVGVFKAVKGGAIATKDAKDMRAVALDTGKFVNKLVPCEVNLKPFVSGLAYMGDEKARLLRSELLAEKHAVITCKDATGSLGGTRVEVYFEKKQAHEIDGVAEGEKITIRIKGSAFSTLVGVFAGKVK